MLDSRCWMLEHRGAVVAVSRARGVRAVLREAAIRCLQWCVGRQGRSK
ncbi:MAG: hypothetical protein ACYTEL_05170 [Planctomycetota bacterium]|jgi:hypothetical protein